MASKQSVRYYILWYQYNAKRLKIADLGCDKFENQLVRRFQPNNVTLIHFPYTLLGAERCQVV